MSWMAKIIFVLIPFLVIGLLAWLKFGGQSDSPANVGGGAPAGRPPPVVRAVTVERQPFDSQLVFNGSLVPYDVTDVRSELNGRVRQIHFSDGQAVEAGDLLVEIDTVELEAEVRSIREQLELAEINAHRQERLFGTNGVTARERDEAVSRREVLRADLDRLEARLEKGRIQAPFSGTLGLRQISLGDLLDPSVLITTLQTVDRLRLDFSVPERHLPSVHVGMPVYFTVAGHRRTFTGKVSALDPRIDRNTRSLLVRADVSNEERLLFPGNYARVELPITREGVIVVPAISVLRSLDSVAVFVVEDGRAIRREVVVGQRTPDSVEIVEGLEPGEVVVSDGVQRTRGGEAVTIQTSEAE